MRAGRNRNTDGSCRFKEWKNYEKNDGKAIGLVSAILPNVKAAQESGRSLQLRSGNSLGQETYELRIGENDCQKRVNMAVDCQKEDQYGR